MILDKSYRLPYYTELINPEGTLSMGVFGDSYARSSQAGIEQWWNYLLAKKIGVKSYDNYGFGGTSFYYTFNTFLENHSKHDVVVIAVTDSSRYHSIISLSSVGTKKIIPTPGLRNIDHYCKDDKFNKYEKELLTQIKHWYMINSLEYAEDMQELMIEEIIRLRPDAVIIPCFGSSFSKKRLKQLKITELHNLYQMTLLQGKSLGIDLHENNYEENPETIFCHFTKEMNQYVADLIYTKYVSGEWNWKIPEFISHKKPLTHYYTKV